MLDPQRLDRTLHEPVRLAIAGILASRPEASFTELRELLSLTDGNLSVHLKALQDSGYVAVEKSFVKNRPRTTARLTKSGRNALERHLDALEEIVRTARGDLRGREEPKPRAQRKR